jgi:tetratricopeptide (TPR) repeat protein
MGQHHHSIANISPEAQRYFNQGLVLLYGFNREEAVRSFRRAGELAPKSPMPHWGVAMALGPHINMDLDLDSDRMASCAAEIRARSLASTAPVHERDLVEALSARCPKEPMADVNRLDTAYSNAMRELARRYPDDPDVVTLFGESLMVLHRWHWWNKDGSAAEGTEEAVQALETVLRRHPDHPGANHLFLHAIEMSPSPERAIPSAQRLMGIVPGAGHLIHMAGHIWRLTGNYDWAADTNETAAKVDEEYIKIVGPASSPYQLGYYPHNLHFIVYARTAQGRYSDAMRAVQRLTTQVTTGFDAMPDMVEYFLPRPNPTKAAKHPIDKHCATRQGLFPRTPLWASLTIGDFSFTWIVSGLPKIHSEQVNAAPFSEDLPPPKRLNSRVIAGYPRHCGSTTTIPGRAILRSVDPQPDSCRSPPATTEQRTSS